MHGSSAYLGGRRKTVEMVALCCQTIGEVSRVALLFETVVNDGSACGLLMLETVGGAVEAGLVKGDLLVETDDRGRTWASQRCWASS